ncbi:MAG: hypothetical protein AAB654_11130 [Acidobacteriota bacterium]
MKPELLIVLDNGQGRALPLARVHEPTLLRAAAQVALRAKRNEADNLARQDPTLGMVAREDADRLTRTLTALIPNLTV